MFSVLKYSFCCFKFILDKSKFSSFFGLHFFSSTTHFVVNFFHLAREFEGITELITYSGNQNCLNISFAEMYSFAKIVA